MESQRARRDLPDGMFLADDEELPAVGIDRHRIDDEIYQHVPDNPADWAEYHMAEDGMPKPTTPTKMPFAPPLSPDTLCCIADTRSFVVRNRWREIMLEVVPGAVQRAEDGRYWIPTGLAVQIVSEKRGLLGLFEIARAIRGNRTLVEPFRPQCIHFVRQMSDFQDEDEHAFLTRLCTARRDDGGEFLGLRDTQMFACDLREPFDAKGTKRCDMFDENKIILGRERIEKGELWDVDAALDGAVDEAQQEPAQGGIFRGKG